MYAKITKGHSFIHGIFTEHLYVREFSGFWWHRIKTGRIFCLWKSLYRKSLFHKTDNLIWVHWRPTPVFLPGNSHGESMGSQRVGCDWATSLSLFTFMHWRRNWQPTPAFLPGESQGRGSLVGCRLWGRRVGHDWSDLAAASYSVCMSIAVFQFIPVTLPPGNYNFVFCICNSICFLDKFICILF